MSTSVFIAYAAIGASLLTFLYMYLTRRVPRTDEQRATSAALRPALAAGAALILAMGLNWGYTTYALDSAAAQRARLTSQQEKIGREVTAKICHTLDLLYSDKPPAGSAAANPSRAYLQRLHADLGQLRPDLGCEK